MKLSGWGRYPIIDANVASPRAIEEVVSLVKKGKAVARGNGRSYGDSAASFTNTIHMKHFNRMLSFDEENGRLVAEAGVLLADIIDAFLKIGWFPSVTPGTKFVTLGGMIAADVHGKNHHKDGSLVTTSGGSTCLHKTAQSYTVLVQRIRSSLLDNRWYGVDRHNCSRWIRLRRVQSGWIEQKTIIAENIKRTIDIFESSSDATYSVRGLIVCKRIRRTITCDARRARKRNRPAI